MAAFNYRLLYDFKSPTYSKSETEAYKLKLQIFDRDLFKINDFICEFEIDLYLMVLDCRLTHRPMHLSKKYYSSYFRDAYNRKVLEQGRGDPRNAVKLDLEFEDEDSFWLSVKRPQDKLPIKIKLDIRVLPGADAVAQRVGEARLEPNHSPYLPPPIGRMTLSLNPLEMLSQLMGQELRVRLQRYLCLLLCLVVFVLMLPMILSDVASKVILGTIGFR